MQTHPDSFQPSQTELRCPSFGPVHKAMVLGALVALTAWGYRLGASHGWEWNNPVLMFLATYAMLLYMCWVLLTGHTTLTASELSQDWFWRKSVALDGIAYVRLFRIRGLEWLIAPRLYVRTGAGPMRAYHAYGVQMWEEFQRWTEVVSAQMNHDRD